MSEMPKKGTPTNTATVTAPEAPKENGTHTLNVVKFSAIPTNAVKAETTPKVATLAGLPDGTVVTIPLAGLQSEDRTNRKGNSVKEWYVLTTDGTRYNVAERTARQLAGALTWARENKHDAVSVTVKHDEKKHLVLA